MSDKSHWGGAYVNSFTTYTYGELGIGKPLRFLSVVSTISCQCFFFNFLIFYLFLLICVTLTLVNKNVDYMILFTPFSH